MPRTALFQQDDIIWLKRKNEQWLLSTSILWIYMGIYSGNSLESLSILSPTNNMFLSQSRFAFIVFNWMTIRVFLLEPGYKGSAPPSSVITPQGPWLGPH